jgi:hypothetical protein
MRRTWTVLEGMALLVALASCGGVGPEPTAKTTERVVFGDGGDVVDATDEDGGMPSADPGG